MLYTNNGLLQHQHHYIDNKCNMKTKLRNIVVLTVCPRSLNPRLVQDFLDGQQNKYKTTSYWISQDIRRF